MQRKTAKQLIEENKTILFSIFSQLSLDSLANPKSVGQAITTLVDPDIRKDIKFGVVNKFPKDLAKVSISEMLPLKDQSALAMTNRFFGETITHRLHKQKEALKVSIEKKVDDVITQLDTMQVGGKIWPKDNNVVTELIADIFHLERNYVGYGIPLFMLSREWTQDKNSIGSLAFRIEKDPFSREYRIYFHNYDSENWRLYSVSDPKIGQDSSTSGNYISYQLRDFLKAAICTARGLIPDEASKNSLKRKLA